MILSEKISTEIFELTKNDFTPFYIYEKQLIRNNCKMFNRISYENKSIHFATMANINQDFLKIVKDEKINVFVNSIIHLQEVKKAGFKEDEIIFTSSALDIKTMKIIHDEKIQINLDSPNQLKQWHSFFPNKKVGIRCNIGDKVKPYSTRAGFFIGKESRLGFTINEILQIQNKNIIKGLHLYVGTDIFDIEYFENCYKELIEISYNFPNLEYLNFGGGFGVSESGEKQFDIDNYGKKVTDLMQIASKKHNKNLKLILEPGRIIGGISGYFVCKITDLKYRDNLTYIGVNASTAQFTRPLMYPESANHPAIIIRDKKILQSNVLINSTVYGCSTYSRDIFCQNRQLPEAQIGDLVIFGNAGSYCASSHSEFLGFPKSQEYFI